MPEEWGTLQIVVNDQDLTFYRDIPTIVTQWSYAEPFADKTLTLTFPAISSFEDESNFPFAEEANIDLWNVKSNGDRQKIWEGYVTSMTTDLDGENDRITVECAGALYQADLFIKPPSFGFREVDAGQAITIEMNTRSRHYGLRLAQMPQATWGNVPTRKLGSFNKFLTGWVAEQLGDAQTPIALSQNEEATTIIERENGYWVGGDHGTVISFGRVYNGTFGKKMENFGSASWRHITEIYTKKNKAYFVADYDFSPVGVHEDSKRGWSITMGGLITPMGWDHFEPFHPSSTHYGEPGSTEGSPFVAINSTPTGNGYLCVNTDGSVFAFGDAVAYGGNPSLSGRTASNGTSYPFDFVIDMAVRDGGYWLLTWLGRVYAYGSATGLNLHGELPLVDRVFTSISPSITGNGFVAMDANCRIYSLGDAPDHGSNGILDYTLIWKDITVTQSGDGYYAVRNDGVVLTFGDAIYLGSATLETNIPGFGGDVIGYTLTKETNRRPVLRTKNMWKEHFTLTTGTPGVSISINRDMTSAFNAFYGEGTDVTGGKWRNTKYTNTLPYSGTYSPPPYPMVTINVYTNNSDEKTSGAVSLWQSAMKGSGWNLRVDGFYDNYDASICRQMQAAAGIPQTGEVDLQTWTTTFLNNPNTIYEGIVNDAYIAPLVVRPEVEPFQYKPNGEILGPNPEFNSQKMRRETYTNYGEKASKKEGSESALAQSKQFIDPGYVGTITLTVDPDEMSRFDIRAGMNLTLKSFRGKNIFFHIAEVSVNVEQQSVTLTVDTQGRDFQTVSAILERDRSIGDSLLKSTRQYSEAKQTEDRFVVFDSEASGGYIPAHATPGGSWNVIRVPAGELGEIVRTEFATFPASLYSIAVFDRQVTAQQLNDYTALFTADEGEGVMDPEFWTLMQAERPELGLVVAWGGQEDLAGTWPLTYNDYMEKVELAEEGEGEFPGLSGVMKDDSSWNYWSNNPPWLWVGIWSFRPCFISGRFYPGPNGGYNFSDVATLADPQAVSPQEVGPSGPDATFEEVLRQIYSWGN